MQHYDCVFCGSSLNYETPDQLQKFMNSHYPTECKQTQNATVKPPEPPFEEEELPFDPSTEDGWEAQTAAFYTFQDRGDEVVGVLRRIDDVPLQGDQVKRATIGTPRGDVSFLLTTQLEPLLMTLPVGTGIKVRYEGTVKSHAGRNVKQFKVWTKRNPSGGSA